MDWMVLLAGFVNSVVVIGIVQAIKLFLPIVRQKMPMLLPLLAILIGPGMTAIQNQVSAWLGIPVDLSPLFGLFTGGTAVAIHQIPRQAFKGGQNENDPAH